ncbi:hypothetical protein PMAYCL1PPCAC_27262, partial [Pristionchus mayeri]
IHGNTIYFTSKNTIFKAVFAPAYGLTLYDVRDKMEGEVFHKGAVSRSKRRSGKRRSCPSLVCSQTLGGIKY